MKKYRLLIIPILLMTLGAKINEFSIDTSKLLTNSKQDYIKSFDTSYKIEDSSKKDDNDEDIIKLTKKATYLLFGKPNNNNETSEEYYNRYNDFLKIRYAPKVPKDKRFSSGLDEKSEEYKDDLVSGLTLPTIFKQVNETRPLYNSYGEIKINKTDKFVISSIVLPNVKYKEEDPQNPKEYVIRKGSTIMYYYFKKLDGEYKLYYLYGESSDELDEYFLEVENNEIKKGLAITLNSDSKLREIYNFSKLDNISEDEIKSISEKNKDSSVYLNAYYNNGIVASGNGFIINDGIVVTSSSFIKKALEKGQFITINSGENVYKMDGIVTVNEQLGIAIIKLEDKISYSVTLSEDKMNVEDPVFMISSKTGVSHTIDSGIVISNNNLQTSIPFKKSDAGSMLINKNGNVIGMVKAGPENKSTSESIDINILKNIQEKFNSIEFSKVKAISMNEIKEKYFYKKSNKEEILKGISKGEWKEFSKIGDIEQSIDMKLVKSSIKDNVISLRYLNEISDYIDGMMLAGSFKSNLIKEGFKEKLKSDSKCIYENEKYEVIIMKEFNYIIVVMVRL